MTTSLDSIDVLHVDDEPGFADMAGTFLEREKSRFSVETTTDASDGLERLADDGFDCVISDYDMPGKNGIEFLEDVREEDADLPFILFTGKGSEEIASDAISAGVTDYLQKEGSSDQYTILANRIQNAVERTRANREREQMRERMELALEETNSVIFEFDFETGDVSRHGAVERFLDIDTERVSTSEEYIERVVHPDDRERVREFYRNLRTGSPDHDVIEYRTNPESGSVRWFRDHTYVATDDGEATRVLGLARDVTERKDRERELERYEAYLRESTDIITVLDESGTIKYETPSVSRILGYEPETLVGDNGFDYIHPDDVDEIAEAFTELVSEPGVTVTVECRFRTADDEWRWIEVRGTNQLAHPAIEGIVTNNRDITEQKKQEAKRAQIIERVTDAIVEVDPDWQFTLVNEQAEELYEMDAEYLLGRNFWDVFSEAEGTRFEAEYRRVMETREPTSFTEYYSGLNGWFDIEVYPEDDGGVAFYFIDVTDRRERERELERRSERFEYVEEVAEIGYWEIDTRTPSPHDVTLSDGVYHIHELSPDDPVDVEKGLEFYHPEDRPQVRTAVERAIADGQPYDLEVRLLTATGSERWVHTVGEPVERDGEIIKVRGVFQDISDRKQQEKRLARQNDRLEQFASIVSHDLRNPLNVAEGRLELAMETGDTEHLDAVARAHERMRVLIEDMLALAREEKDATDIEPVELAEMVDECWRNVDTAGATLVTDTEREIRADRNRLQQLLENLFRNAIEHGGENVTVTVGDLPDGFYVADDGSGIPEGEREQVFEAGYSTSETGTGFGLPIVRRVTDVHGWEVTITDSEDDGTQLEITGVETDRY